MLSTLISSKTRIKLLLKFFLNSDTVGYLRGLESEFGESSNAIRMELNRFEEAGLLTTFADGNKKLFRANTHHPLFQEIHNILLKHVGLDQIVEQVVQRLGNVEKVYLTGAFACGSDSPVVELLVVGKPDPEFLQKLAKKASLLIQREIKYTLLPPNETTSLDTPNLLLWTSPFEGG